MEGQKILNNTLKLNSAFSMLSGLDFIFFDNKIMSILSDQDFGSLMPIGIILVGFSIFVLIVSMMKDVNKYLVGTIIILDALWIAGSFFLVAFASSFFTQLGLVLIGFIAVIITFFAYFQSVGLARHLNSKSTL